MGQTFSIIFYSLVAGLATILGMVMVILKEEWVVRNSRHVHSFAAGLILGIAFFHLFPESLTLTGNALTFIFIGFLIFYLLEHMVVLHSGSEIHYKEKHNPQHTKAIVMFSGLFFHSLLDGLIIGVGFEIDSTIGIMASLGVIMHEFPEGVTTYSLLITKIKRELAFNLSVAVALATPIGALISLTFLGGLSKMTIGVLLAMAGGTFLYIAATDLIPETHEEGFASVVSLFSGVLSLYILSQFIGK